MAETGNDVIWFTSTMSVDLNGEHGGAAFAGLYKCDLEADTGDCVKPQLIVDRWDVDGTHHRGLDLMNVVIDKTHNMFYTGYFDGQRESWEILRAAYDSRPIVLESFFRTTQDVRNNECMLRCCEDAGHTYYQVEPRSFVVDGDDIFISWDGFYQDCSDEFSSKRGLLWSIGVSKLSRSPECVGTDGVSPVSFDECSTPVSIFYQTPTARETILGYSGIAVSRSPSGRRLFYLSVIDNVSGVNGAGAVLVSEVWVMPEGENYSKNPKASQSFGGLQVAKEFLEYPVDDAATMRLRFDDAGIPTALCRTVYDAGIVCYALDITEVEELHFDIKSERTYVTREQLVESCTVESSHYPITKIIPPLSTGLEVLWKEGSPDDMPEMLFFGCYGEINGLGNFTTALSDGTIHTTLKGGHPGTILFGVDIAPPQEPIGDFIAPCLEDLPSRSSQRGSRLSQAMSFLALASLAVALFVKKRRLKQHGARQQRGYELVLEEEECSQSYVELA